MSEKTLRETVTEAMEMAGSWFVDPERRARLLERLDLRLRRAETAEAYAAWMIEHAPDTVTWDDYHFGEGLLLDHVAAREAVRTLEDQSDGS